MRSAPLVRLPLRFYGLLLLASCARSEFVGAERAGNTAGPAVTVPPGTSSWNLEAATSMLLQGTGNVAKPTDNRKAGQRPGPAARALNVTANTSTKQAGRPRWIFALMRPRI